MDGKHRVDFKVGIFHLGDFSITIVVKIILARIDERISGIESEGSASIPVRDVLVLV